MEIKAQIKNSLQQNEVAVETDGNQKEIFIPAKTTGQGSLVNGGELLFLSLATCFCNDLYREAAKRKLILKQVEVIVTGAFGKEGEPASNIAYQVNIESDHLQQEIKDLINYVDKVAEVHNTLRNGAQVTLSIA